MRQKTLDLNTAFDSWGVTAQPVGSRPGDAAVSADFVAALRFEAERGSESSIQDAAGALAMTGSEVPSVATGPHQVANVAVLLRELEREIAHGTLRVERRARPRGVATRSTAVEVVRSPPPAKESNETFFDVRYVDETGMPINGVPVRITAGGNEHELKTNAGGVVLLEPVFATSASASLTDLDPVEKLLDKRWTQFRLQKAPKVGNMFSFAFDRKGIPAVPLKAAVPHTVVLTPPVGRIFMKLSDKTGRVIHRERPYEISGPRSFSGKTNDQGELGHEDVFPGDYTLKLTLDFFDGKEKVTNDYESPAVVLPPTASLPERRMLGVVPSATLVRARALFNTSKAFILPPGVFAFRALRDIYLANNPSQLLVVGHADTQGGKPFNDELSLDRAKSVIAFLKDDVDTWLGFYDDPESKRWGKPEDRMMLQSAPDFVTKPKGEDAVKWFQRTRKLAVDGKAGPQTRRKLIEEYMALDGATLTEKNLEIEATAHGCGEDFPLNEAGDAPDSAPVDDKPDAVDRRVELFFFEPEFGVVPAPSSETSKKEYPRWQELVLERIELVAGAFAGPALVFLELVDAHFRTNSAVVMPEGEAPSADPDEHAALTSIGVFANTLRFATENSGKKILVAGHADTTASVEFNQKLSEERARCALALLMGDRSAFQSLCDTRHTVSDIKQILAWVARTFSGFDCDPGSIDDDAGTSVAPVKKFQVAYNTNKKSIDGQGEALTVDGKAGPLTWGAFFDCYEFALREEMGESKNGLKSLRQQVTFADDKHRALGFSEHFPLDEIGRDGFKSQANRRVEILFFDSGEEPDIAASAADPETSEIYLPGRFSRTPLPPRPTGRSARTVRIFLLDPSHRRMPGARYTLIVGTQMRSGRADGTGLLVERRILPTGECELEWSESTLGEDKPHRYSTTLTLDVVAPGTEPRDEVATDRLRNLGYSGTLESMVFAFQADYDLPRAEWFDAATAAKLEEVHAQGLEAALHDEGEPFVPEANVVDASA